MIDKVYSDLSEFHSFHLYQLRRSGNEIPPGSQEIKHSAVMFKPRELAREYDALTCNQPIEG